MNNMEVAEKMKHPIHYTVFQPNVLIGANSDMKLMELRLYSELLNFNHRENPDQMSYFIPYEVVTSSTGRDVSKNSKREYMRLTKMFQKRVFDLDEEFMRTHFGKKYPASIVPFPVISYEDNGFEITLEPHFKQILLRLEIGFTKGDIDLLRSYRHTYSHRMYWIIRQNQWRESEITLEIEKLKEALGCPGKYKSFQNFKRRVLQPIQEEFKDTWVEFSYTLIRKGRGGAATAITLRFQKDLHQEEALQLGKVYHFEKVLASYQIHEREIKKIRQKVTMKESLLDDFHWSEKYVQTVIDLVKESYRLRKKIKGGSQIRKMGPYILKVLTEGWYVDRVKDRWKAIEKAKASQLDMFEDQPKNEIEESKEQYRTSYESFREMYELHVEIHGEDITEAEYADRLGYRIEGDSVVKIIS